MSAWRAARELLLRDDPALEADEAMLIELLGPEEGQVIDVLERCARAARHAEMMAEAAKKRADEIAERQKRYATRAKRLRDTTLAIMTGYGAAKHEMADMTLSIRAPLLSVKVEDEAAVPDDYWRVTRAIDKTAIGAALKAGEAVPGCALREGQPFLSVSVK